MISLLYPLLRPAAWNLLIILAFEPQNAGVLVAIAAMLVSLAYATTCPSIHIQKIVATRYFRQSFSGANDFMQKMLPKNATEKKLNATEFEEGLVTWIHLVDERKHDPFGRTSPVAGLPWVFRKRRTYREAERELKNMIQNGQVGSKYSFFMFSHSFTIAGKVLHSITLFSF